MYIVRRSKCCRRYLAKLPMLANFKCCPRSEADPLDQARPLRTMCLCFLVRAMDACVRQLMAKDLRSPAWSSEKRHTHFYHLGVAMMPRDGSRQPRIGANNNVIEQLATSPSYGPTSRCLGKMTRGRCADSIN